MRTFLCCFSFYVGFKNSLCKAPSLLFKLYLQISGFHGNVKYNFTEHFASRSGSLGNKPVSFPQYICLYEDVFPAQLVV